MGETEILALCLGVIFGTSYVAFSCAEEVQKVPCENITSQLPLPQSQLQRKAHTGKVDIIIQQFLEPRLRLEVNQLKEMISTVLRNVLQI